MTEENFNAWSFDNSVSFYTEGRNKAEDLYESEAAILLPIVPHIESVLDIGCAAGGFYEIFLELDPSISYTGVDTSRKMIAEAKTRYPKGDFHIGDGGPLPFETVSFDLVLCTSVLHHNPRYLEMITDFKRIARKYIIVDLPRLVTKPYSFDVSHSYMTLGERFPIGSEQLDKTATKVPYVLANVQEMFNKVITRMGGQLSGLAVHGYFGSPHDTSVTIPISPVIFTVALFVKGNNPCHYHLNVPEEAVILVEQELSKINTTAVNSVEEILKRTN